MLGIGLSCQTLERALGLGGTEPEPQCWDHIDQGHMRFFHTSCFLTQNISAGMPWVHLSSDLNHIFNQGEMDRDWCIDKIYQAPPSTFLQISKFILPSILWISGRHI